MAAKRELTRADILPIDEFAAVREQRRTAIRAIKRHRRVEVGPAAAFYFESFDTMWWQVHEMLRVENGGEAQIADELVAYNPMIPDGAELVATVMFEIDDPARRDRLLRGLGGVEHKISISVGGETVKAVPEDDVERTDATGRASSVHFLHFPFTPAAIAAFRAPGAQVVVAIDHDNYGHMAVMPDAVREALAEDFD